MASILDQSIERITIRTSLGPDVVIDRPFSPGKPSPLLAVLKPQVEIKTTWDSKPLVLAPYGAPGPTRWPLFAAVVGILAGVGAAALIAKFRRRKELPRG